MEEPIKEEVFKGFEEIALCFSGGGYRAACFSLGTISLFDKLGLLSKVKTISTVSGGTITGVKLAQALSDGDTFAKFFVDYYKWLKRDELTKTAISHIKSRKEWKKQGNDHKRRNPINAFAIEYNKFTYHRTLGQVQEAINNKKTTLEKVIFNTTDFSHSFGFKFQNITQGSVLGNKKIQKLGYDYNQNVSQFKLGDILASSSAFPGGFEPIRFPHDFISKKDAAIMKLKDVDEIGLMDGGIIDNQGLSSILSSTKKYDLYFVSDVASPYDTNPFQFAGTNRSIQILNILANPIFLIIFITLTIFASKLNWPWWTVYIFLILSTITLTLQGLFIYISKIIKKKTGILEKFKVLPHRFGFYIFDRINSLVKMTSEVFLKNARRSNYENAYNKYSSKISTATIYELRCANEEGIPEYQNSWYTTIKEITGDIPKKMKEVSTYAASFDTTLWFTESEKQNGMLNAVVACGEYTACYNIITHLAVNHQDEIKVGGGHYVLYHEALKLWKEFCKDPYYLLSQRIGSDNVIRVKDLKNLLPEEDLFHLSK